MSASAAEDLAKTSNDAAVAREFGRLSQRAAWAEGQPISDLMSRALAHPNLISLAAGFVDQTTLPVEATREAWEGVFSSGDAARAALQYGTTPGYPPLREAILERHVESDGQTPAESGLDLKQVVLTAGSNQLLHLVGESLLDPGDIVLCAAPTYLVFLGTLANLGSRSVGVAADAEGMLPEALNAQLAALDKQGELPRVKAIYLVSHFDNPTGATLPSNRRGAILQIARRWSRHGKIYVIDDAAYQELRYEGETPPSIRRFERDCDAMGHVVVAGTFSKSFSPGVRVGWGILPRELVEPVCNQKGNIDFGSPNLSQHLMSEVLERGQFEPHVARLRAGYRVKRDAMLAALDAVFGACGDVQWHPPEGGLYVWLKLPPTLDTGPTGLLFDRAVAAGMLYVPGQFCYPSEGEPVARNTIRLSFGVQSPEGIRRGIEALGRAVEGC